MTFELIRKSAMDEERLDGADYLQSLVKAAYRLKLIDESCVERIQMQILQILSGHVERYTRGESNSVTVEKAQMLTQSILYSLGVRLKSLPDNREALSATTGRPLAEIFEEGVALIRERIGSAEKLLERAQAGRIITDLEAYNETVDEALPGFFQAYDPDFSAHETPASIDYPLGHDRMDLTGIEYIFVYLQKLDWENRLCSHYSDLDLQMLLAGYDRHYSGLLVNISQLVLTNALGNLMLGGSAMSLRITGDDRERLVRQLAGRSGTAISVMLEMALKRLFEELDVDEPSFRQYVRDCADGLAVRLENALKSGRLQNIFIEQREDLSSEMIYCDDGRKLDDRTFRELAERISRTGSPSEKIALIARHVRSLGDMADLLEAGCLEEQDLHALFESLGDTELALLLVRLNVSPCDGGICLDEDERDWKYSLASFVNSMDSGRLERLIALSEKIAI